MKLKILPALAILLLLLLSAACSKPSKGPLLLIWNYESFDSQPHISQQITKAAGNTFTVWLGIHREENFQWSEPAQISDQTVVRQIEDDFAIMKKVRLTKLDSDHVWTFKALKKGTSTITLEYSQPWEGGEKGKWTYNLTVVVE